MLDSEAQILPLPQDKLEDILHRIHSWLGRRSATKRELQSLIGRLSVTSKLVPAGIPVALDKLEGPATRISFLGIMLDSEAQILPLPQDKLEDILHRIHSWLGRRSATKRELQSLIGRLLFTSKVVPAGIPVALDKLEGPATRISFLGILLDSEAQILPLPQDKLEDILHRIHSWLGRRSATKRELQSLIGRLLFTSKVVPAGIPVALDKLEGPATRISFLGILLDSEAQILPLPQDKLEDILHRIHSWLGRHSATKRELQSLIGRLSFTSKLVPVGIPVALDKLEGPATCISFQGILLDSEAQILPLPQDKLEDILHRIHSWLGRRSATKLSSCP